MSHNTKQGLIVIAIFFGTAITVLTLISIISGRHLRASALNSVRQSLLDSYIETFFDKTGKTNTAPRQLGSAEILATFCDTNRHQLKSTSFIQPTDIWISSKPVQAGATNLLCVVTAFGDKHYGIDGNGQFREVPSIEFKEWPCTQAWQPENGP